MINKNMVNEKINEVLDLMSSIKDTIKEAEGLKAEAESVINSSTKQLEELGILLAEISNAI